MRTNRLLRACWILVVSCLAVAAHAAAEALDPRELAIDTTNRMLATLRAEHELLEQDPQRLYALVDEIVLPKFDFRRMSQLVLGKYWRQATPEQRERFVAEFRTLLVRTYSKALIDYRDLEVRFPELRPVGDSRTVTVDTEVILPDGKSVLIQYVMYRSEDGWKVFDVIIEGVSLVTNYRSSFAQEIRTNGIDGLIAQLAERNQNESSEPDGTTGNRS